MDLLSKLKFACGMYRFLDFLAVSVFAIKEERMIRRDYIIKNASYHQMIEGIWVIFSA